MLETIRGVTFVSTYQDNLLKTIFRDIDLRDFHWFNVMSQNEVWANTRGGTALENEYYDGKSFLEIIDSEYWIIFIRLQAYREAGSYHDIHTYEEFQKSDCQLICLIADGKFVHIYVKDQAILNSIYKNALASNF